MSCPCERGCRRRRWPCRPPGKSPAKHNYQPDWWLETMSSRESPPHSACWPGRTGAPGWTRTSVRRRSRPGPAGATAVLSTSAAWWIWSWRGDSLWWPDQVLRSRQLRDPEQLLETTDWTAGRTSVLTSGKWPRIPTQWSPGQDRQVPSNANFIPQLPTLLCH